jgi:hypothetical protein
MLLLAMVAATFFSAGPDLTETARSDAEDHGTARSCSASPGIDVRSPKGAG